MISYGWRLIGSKEDVGTSATAPAVFQTDYLSSAYPKLNIDGYSYVSLALLHTAASGVVVADVYGTNFTGEASQSDVAKNPAITVKVCTLGGGAAGVDCPAGSIPGVDVATEWASMSLTDVTSTGDGEILGLMSIYAGFKGAEMVETGTAGNTFGSFATTAHHTIAGSASIAGSVTIPCSLFSSLQFDMYSTVGTDDVYLIGCAFG